MPENHHPASMKSLIPHLVSLTQKSVEATPGAFSIQQIVDSVRAQVRADMPPAQLDWITTKVVKAWIDANLLSQGVEEKAMVEKTMEVMKKHNLETAGDAAGFLQRKMAH